MTMAKALEKLTNLKGLYGPNLPSYIVDGIFNEVQEDFQNFCPHNPVIITDSLENNQIEAKCLFCGKEIRDRRELDPNSKVFNAVGTSVPKEMKFEILYTAYRNAVLEGRSEEFCEKFAK